MKKTGFTLVEAIVVLIILGIIASLCVAAIKPENTNQEGSDIRAEKAVSVLQQAITMMLINDCARDNLNYINISKTEQLSINDGSSDTSKATKLVGVFKKYLVLNAKTISASDDYLSSPVLDFKKVSIGKKLNEMYSDFFYLDDGTLMGFRFYPTCESTETYANPPRMREYVAVDNICGSIFVDTNGVKKPNKLGSDQFVMPFDGRGIKFNE